MPSQTITLQLRSTSLEAVQMCEWLKGESGVRSAEIVSESHVKGGLLDRAPLRQTEVLDVLIALVVNLASAGAFEIFMRRFRRKASAHGIGLTRLPKKSSPRPKVKAPKSRTKRKTPKRRKTNDS